MKKSFKYLMLLVPVALSFASCMNDSFDNPVIPAGPEADKYAYTDEMDLSVAPWRRLLPIRLRLLARRESAFSGRS